MMHRNVETVLALAHREVMHFLRDTTRILITFTFPVVFIGVIGVGLRENITGVSFDFVTFAFTGVLAQILFQTTATGVMSLNEERGTNVIQEAFVAPVSRVAILFGKVLGECGVAMVQCAAVILFGIMIDIPITAHQVLLMLPAALFVCLLGGAFGVLVLSRIRTAQTAYQLFPLIIFPQIILAGVFAPVKELPPFALIPSRLMPLTYAVDWIRAIFYRGLPEFHAVVIYGALVDAIVVGVLFLGCLIVGTYLFIERERNR